MNQHRLMRHAARLQRGFTLVEIMVVVVIIGLLVALTGPSVWSMLTHGQEETAAAKCKEFYDKAHLWKTIKKRAPETLEEMQAPLKPGDDDFIQDINDPWGNPFHLERDGQRVKVYSWGPDGLEGTDDDIVYPKQKE